MKEEDDDYEPEERKKKKGKKRKARSEDKKGKKKKKKKKSDSGDVSIKHRALNGREVANYVTTRLTSPSSFTWLTAFSDRSRPVARFLTGLLLGVRSRVSGRSIPAEGIG